MNIADGRKVVTTAGTRVQLGASLPINSVIITALEANTGVICVGGATVKAEAANRTGAALAAKQSVTVYADDLADLYIDATANGEGVSYLAMTEQ